MLQSPSQVRAIPCRCPGKTLQNGVMSASREIVQVFDLSNNAAWGLFSPICTGVFPPTTNLGVGGSKGSTVRLTLVGDPRQHTLSTNIGPRNKKYRGSGIKDWFAERSGACGLQTRDVSYRCNQTICDFADAIYPDMPKTRSYEVGETGHDGIFYISPKRVAEYLDEFRDVTVLRDSKRADTLGLPAMNIGVSKGSTFDRVMIFPTKPMVEYLMKRDPSKLRAPERLYVAVTRAKFSVAFVVDDLADLGVKTVARTGW